MTVHLYGLTISPWTRRAKWALDHHRIDYHEHEFIPLLSEPALRLRARRGLAKRLTVPILISDQGDVIADSYEIGRWADSRGESATLSASDPEVRQWIERLEPVFLAARARTTTQTLRDPEALRATARSILPVGPAASALWPLAYVGVRYIMAKYDVAAHESALLAHQEAARGALRALQGAITGRVYICHDRFSLADVFGALAVEVSAPTPRYSPALDDVMRATWRDDALQGDEALAPLLAWRDMIMEQHLPTPHQARPRAPRGQRSPRSRA